ncbi:MAG TPA: LytTR family DNA-binding domain-containing protein, partial [Saprospiraceae bacterium]|nr:LytTR family DNA-binding domain-containing protein [Saprospiraceae bacterium]
DEKPAATRLVNMLRKVEPEANILGITEGVESTLNFLDQNPNPDLVFLDIHLADGSAFEIFNHHPMSDMGIIFSTAFDQYAIEAFKVNALYYLLKPIKQEELEKALSRYKEIKDRDNNYKEIVNKLLTKPVVEKRFLIRMGQSLRLVHQQDIAFFYTSDKITFMMTREGRKYPLDYTLENLEIMIDPAKFFRINRQYIIHIEAIQQMHAHSKARVRIDLLPAAHEEVIVSTEKSPLFKKWLEGEE